MEGAPSEYFGKALFHISKIQDAGWKRAFPSNQVPY